MMNPEDDFSLTEPELRAELARLRRETKMGQVNVDDDDQMGMLLIKGIALLCASVSGINSTPQGTIDTAAVFEQHLLDAITDD